jgi:hypothetical protein
MSDSINIWPWPDPEATRAKGAEAERNRIIELVEQRMDRVSLARPLHAQGWNEALEMVLAAIKADGGTR